jgi:transposase InsO family protein
MKLCVSSLCNAAEMSRQNYYKVRKIRQRARVDEDLVRELVEEVRKRHPRMGMLKLYKLLKSQLFELGIKLGRDRFMKVLVNQGLMVEPLPKAPRTTNSSHSLPVFTNLVKDKELTGANQVWVSDITYIRTSCGFVYLSLITDMYSRKIVGYHLSSKMNAESCIVALNMAFAQLPERAEVIHHSDRGSQYCSHKYVECLKDRLSLISMTETNHCAENALAERMNGILKQEYYLGSEFRSLSQARKAVDEAVYLYNRFRPHRSLGMYTPEQIHGKAA